MEVGMATRPLPDDPNLEHLKKEKEAKALHTQVRAGDSGAVALVREFHPGASDLTQIKLADAQLTIARAYGFPSWRRLRAYVETIARYSRSLRYDVELDASEVGNRLLRLACLNYAADGPDRWQAARDLLAERPGLARASIHTIAAVGDEAAARELLDADRAQARLRGGPYDWEPLMYTCYSRLNSTPLPSEQTYCRAGSHDAKPLGYRELAVSEGIRQDDR
jgi:hypothetical protein